MFEWVQDNKQCEVFRFIASIRYYQTKCTRLTQFLTVRIRYDKETPFSKLLKSSPKQVSMSTNCTHRTMVGFYTSEPSGFARPKFCTFPALPACKWIPKTFRFLLHVPMCSLQGIAICPPHDLSTRLVFRALFTTCIEKLELLSSMYH